MIYNVMYLSNLFTITGNMSFIGEINLYITNNTIVFGLTENSSIKYLL